MSLNNKKLLLILYFIVSVFVINIYGNTSRDLGPEPELNEKKINQWILFYTNIERVKRNLVPLQYDVILSKAAKWQSNYCMKIGTLSHYSNVSGMKDPKARIIRFGGKVRSSGENVIVEFTSNVANRRYYIRTDRKGKFKDYGDYEVYWFNEKQLAEVMVKSWMNSPNHRANILQRLFFSMGAGVAKGTYSREKSYYGSQVFSGEKNPEFKKLKVEGPVGEEREFKIKYIGEYTVSLISIDRDKKMKNYKIIKKENTYSFNKKDKNAYFICLYDKKNDIIYPVKVLK